MKILFPILSMIVLSLSAHLATAEENCEWKVRRAKYHFHKVKNVTFQYDEYTGEGPNSSSSISEVPVTHKLVTGVLIVEQNCYVASSGFYKERTTNIPLNLSVDLYGANGRIQGGGTYPNTTISIRNLQGNTLADLIDRPFYGGKLLLELAFIVGVNPNASVLFNSAGLAILDQEKWLVGINAGLGLNLSGVRAQFHLPQATQTNEVVSGGALGTSSQTQTTDLQTVDDARKVRF